MAFLLEPEAVARPYRRSRRSQLEIDRCASRGERRAGLAWRAAEWRPPCSRATVALSKRNELTKEDADAEVHRAGRARHKLHGRRDRWSGEAAAVIRDRDQRAGVGGVPEDATGHAARVPGGGDAERVAVGDPVAARGACRRDPREGITRTEERRARCVRAGRPATDGCDPNDRLQVGRRLCDAPAVGEGARDDRARHGTRAESHQSDLPLPWRSRRGQEHLSAGRARCDSAGAARQLAGGSLPAAGAVRRAAGGARIGRRRSSSRSRIGTR